MKCRLPFALLAVSLFAFTLTASARDVVVPAGTLLQCTLNEPNLSSATVDVGDPVLCHLRGTTVFGQQAFPRGSYLVGHVEAEKDPGHFVGKGYLKLQFDRIGVPSGDLPLEAKVISTRGYKVDKEGKIDGKGHARRDVIEWMLPPLWPWKVIMLPARGPRPKLKGETVLSLRLMDDVQVRQFAQSFGREPQLFGRPQGQSFGDSVNGAPEAVFRDASVPPVFARRKTLGPVWDVFGEPRTKSLPESGDEAPQPIAPAVRSTSQQPVTLLGSPARLDRDTWENHPLTIIV